MKAYLDDQPLATDRPSLSAALQAGAQEALQQGRVVVEVYVDGEQVHDQLLDDPSDDITDAEVRLVSVEPKALAREALLGCVDALGEANWKQIEAAELVQSGKTEAALAPLGHALDVWQAVSQAVEQSSGLLRGSVQEELPLDTLEGLLTDLAGQLEEIRSSLAREDWSALADVLAYDMPQQVDRWKEGLGAIADRLAQ